MYIGQTLVSFGPASLQVSDLFGVPYRIRTGVAAVKEGQKAIFEIMVDDHGLLKPLLYRKTLSTVIRPCLATSVPYNCRTF